MRQQARAEHLIDADLCDGLSVYLDGVLVTSLSGPVIEGVPSVIVVIISVPPRHPITCRRAVRAVKSSCRSSLRLKEAN